MAVSDYTAQINAAAAKYGVDPGLVSAVMQTESGGDPNANSGDAQGLMQLTPGTAAGLGVIDPFDPAQSIDGGTKYLSQLLARYNGNTSLAIAGYNAGPGNVDKYGLGALNVKGADPQYLAKVMALWKPVSSAVQQYSVASGYGSNPNAAGTAPSPSTSTPNTKAAASGFNAADPFGIGAAFDNAIGAAKTIALEVFVGAAALALLSGGILWLASTDSAVRGAVVKAAAA